MNFLFPVLMVGDMLGNTDWGNKQNNSLIDANNKINKENAEMNGAMFKSPISTLDGRKFDPEYEITYTETIPEQTAGATSLTGTSGFLGFLGKVINNLAAPVVGIFDEQLSNDMRYPSAQHTWTNTEKRSMIKGSETYEY